MRKTIPALFLLLMSLCLLLSGCGKNGEGEKGLPAPEAETAAPQPEETAAPQPEEPGVWDGAFRSGNAVLEETDLKPADYAGFTIGFRPGDETPLFEGAEPVRNGEGGIRFYEMPEELARRTFAASGAITIDGGGAVYKNGSYTYPLTVGPDGTVLWFGVMPVDAGMGLYTYIAFVQRDREVVVVSVSESRGAGDEKGVLSQYVSSLIRTGRFGAFDWSRDGRYLFLNDLENWQANKLATLPYLLDTRTGEVFLLYSRPDLDQDPRALHYPAGHPRKNEKTCCTVWDGHFSRDGRYLYLILYSNLPDWTTEKAFMRWDLQAETMEQCCWLDNTAGTFAEIEDGRWLVSNTGFIWQTVAAGDAGFTMQAVPPLFRAGSGGTAIRFYGGLSGNGAVAAVSAGYGRVLLGVLRDPAGTVNTWYTLASPADDTLRALSPEEAAEIIGSPPDDTARIRGFYLAPVRNTPYVLVSVDGGVADPGSPDPKFTRVSATLLLDTGTMEMKALRNTETTLAGSHELAVSGEVFAGDRTAYRIVPDAPAEPAAAE